MYGAGDGDPFFGSKYVKDATPTRSKHAIRGLINFDPLG